MLGLDQAGKTTTLYQMRLGKDATNLEYAPTIGFSVEEVECDTASFHIWDIGGAKKLRPLWKDYYNNTDAIIYVIDLNDGDRFKEACLELDNLYQEPKLLKCPVLVYANRKDAKGAPPGRLNILS